MGSWESARHRKVGRRRGAAGGGPMAVEERGRGPDGRCICGRSLRQRWPPRSGGGRGPSASASPRHSSLSRASAPAVRPIRLRAWAIGCPRCPPSASLRRFAFAMPPIRPRPALRAWGAAQFGVGQAIAPRRHPFLPPGGQGPTPPVPPRLGDDPRPSGLPTSVAERRQRRHLPPEVSTSGGCEAIATAGRRSGLAPPVK